LNQIPARPVFTDVPNESWGMRLFRIGCYYADFVPFMLFSALRVSLSWIQGIQDVPENDPNAAWHTPYINRIRRWLFNILNVLIDFSVPENPNAEDTNRLNMGVLITLLFSMKFLSLWFVVIYFPQYTDAKGVFLLLLLTIFFGLYTFNNRTRIRNENGEHLLH